MNRRCLLALLAIGLLNAQDTFKGVERIVAVGDVHGGYAAFVDTLRAANIINDKNDWSGGRAHFVQLGDVMDRGADSRKVLDLLMDLEKQAQKAGGFVHCLIGNHEAMNMYGDLRYVVPGEFSAFAGNETQAKVEAYFRMETRGIRPRPDAAFRAKWLSAHPPGWVEHRAQFAPDGRYGKWIRSHRALIRINDTLFVHAGISPKYASKSIRDINNGVEEELRDFSKMTDEGFVRDDQGPLWYRGIAQEDPALAPHVQQILKNFSAKRIVVGHTPTGGQIKSFYNGAVLAIDVGLGPVYGAHRTALVIENGQLFSLSPDKKTLLP